MNHLRIVLNQHDRQSYVDDLLQKDGLAHVTEDPKAVYCPMSLTQTPDEIKAFVQLRQHLLITEVLQKAGLTAYDPSCSPFSPDMSLIGLPQEVYMVDSGKIVGARFFVGHNLTASTGFGVEVEKASKYNRIAVILHDKNIRVSRMQPHRVIYLQYDNFELQAADFVQVFQLLSEYEPGMGFDGQEPVLVGYKKDSDEPINLEKLVYDSFPQFKYVFNGQASTVLLSATNPELFSEFNGDNNDS